VSCSILVFTLDSPTSPIPHLTIQYNSLKKLTALITVSISGAIFGIFGAGGRTGNSILMFGINEGNSGRVGGDGNNGIVGNERGICTHIPINNLSNKIDIFSRSAADIFALITILGGCGRFGNSKRGTDVGVN